MITKWKKLCKKEKTKEKKKDHRQEKKKQKEIQNETNSIIQGFATLKKLYNTSKYSPYSISISILYTI